MSGPRLKALSLVSIVLVAALALTSATQEWFGLELASPVGRESTLTVGGAVAAPALTALALASLALAGALAIAGPVFRAVLGVLQILLGACVVLSAVTALADPVAAGSSLVTAATAIAGDASVAALVASTTSTPWPILALVSGVLMAVLGVVVLGTLRRWPGSGRRRSVSRFEPADGRGAAAAATDDGDIDPVVSWDELSRGDDPTSPQR